MSTADAPPAAPVREGELFDGKFRIERTLGAGGMGVVVAATHVALGVRVALKFVATAANARPERLDRLRREARAAAQIESEHVTRVLDLAGLDGDRPYIVLEYLEGTDLAAHLDARGPLSLPRAVDFLLEACEAVAEAHARGIVHRDLKPANLFLARRGNGTEIVKVLDFGIAKHFAVERGDHASLTGASDLLGSPRYMSPEQLRSATDVTARCDVWALGVVLYELLSGHTPFERTSTAAIAAAILNETPAPLRSLRPDIPEALEAAIARCFERDPGARLPNVAELAMRIAPYGSKDAARSSLASIRAWADRNTAETSTLDGRTSPAGRAEARDDDQTLARSALGTATTAALPPARAQRTRRSVAAAALVVGVAGAALAAIAIARSGRAPPPEAGALPPETATASASAPPSETSGIAAAAALPTAEATPTAAPTSSGATLAARVQRRPVDSPARAPARAGAAQPPPAGAKSDAVAPCPDPMCARK